MYLNFCKHFQKKLIENLQYVIWHFYVRKDEKGPRFGIFYQVFCEFLPAEMYEVLSFLASKSI